MPPLSRFWHLRKKKNSLGRATWFIESVLSFEQPTEVLPILVVRRAANHCFAAFDAGFAPRAAPVSGFILFAWNSPTMPFAKQHHIVIEPLKGSILCLASIRSLPESCAISWRHMVSCLKSKYAEQTARAIEVIVSGFLEPKAASWYVVRRKIARWPS